MALAHGSNQGSSSKRKQGVAEPRYRTKFEETESAH